MISVNFWDTCEGRSRLATSTEGRLTSARARFCHRCIGKSLVTKPSRQFLNVIACAIRAMRFMPLM